MGSPGGEPKVLLNALSPMLGTAGDIKTPHEIMRIVGLMKDAEKMMSRCVYLNILKATCREAMQVEDKRETLDKFLSAGGWGVLNKWLMEFSRTENFPVLLELMDVLRILPITVDLLRQGNCGKLVKSMTKFENMEVKKNAQLLMKQWKNMIRGGQDKKPTNGDANDGQSQAESSAIKRAIKDVDNKGPPEKKPKGEKGKIKLIDPLPKQIGETSAFMQALQQASAPVKKKRRNSGTKPTLPLDEILNKPGGEKRDGYKVPSSPQEGSSPLHGDAVDHGPYSPVDLDEDNQHVDANGQLVIDKRPNKKRKKKRSLVWAPDDKICQIHYFELYEGEKSSHHSRNFSAAMQHELSLEKKFMSSKRHTIDHMVEKVRWVHPPVVDNHAIPNFHKGEKSREKFNQAEREKSVLAFIFLTRDSLPDSPVEPEYDPESHSSRTAPKTIPHDEEGTIFPVPKLSIAHNNHPQINEQDFITPPQASNFKQNTMSPAVQNIMSQLLKSNTAMSPTSGGESAEKSLTPSVQSINASFLAQSSTQLLQTSGQPSNADARSMQSNMNPGNRPIQQPINPSIPPNPGGMPPPAASAPLLQQPQPNNGIGISQSQDWRTGPPEQDWRASTGDWRMNDDEWRAGRDDWRADPSLYYGVNGPPNGPPRGGGSYRGQRPRFDGPSHDGPDNHGGRRGRGYPYLHDRGGRFPDRGGWRGSSDRGRGGMRGGPDRGRGGMDRGRGHSGPDRGRGGHDRGRRGGPHSRGPRDDPRGDDNYVRRDVCRHYMSARGCRNGDKCSFIHTEGRGPGR